MLYIITHTYPEPKKMFTSYEFEFLEKEFPNDYKILSISDDKREKTNVIHTSLFRGFKKLFFTSKWFKLIPKIFSLNLKELARNTYSLLIALDLMNKIKFHNDDIILSYWFTRSSIIAYYLNQMLGCKYIAQGHGSDIYVYPPKNLKEVLENSEEVITVAKQNKEYLEEKYFLSKEIKCFYMGVSQKFADNKIEKYQSDKVKFLTVARYENVKGVDILLKAVNEIKNDKSLKNVEFVIYGDGSKKKDYLSYIKKNNLENIVKLNGWINRSDLKEELKNSIAYILPSRSEGLPIALMEACAYSLPIIATNVGGVREVAKEGWNAYIVEKENPNLLGKRIIELLKDKKLTEKGKNSFAIYREKFTLERNMKQKYEMLLKFGDKGE